MVRRDSGQTGPGPHATRSKKARESQRPAARCHKPGHTTGGRTGLAGDREDGGHCSHLGPAKAPLTRIHRSSPRSVPRRDQQGASNVFLPQDLGRGRSRSEPSIINCSPAAHGRGALGSVGVLPFTKASPGQGLLSGEDSALWEGGSRRSSSGCTRQQAPRALVSFLFWGAVVHAQA